MSTSVGAITLGTTAPGVADTLNSGICFPSFYTLEGIESTNDNSTVSVSSASRTEKFQKA